MGICSDESPPRGKRFTGYRFQITWVYVPLIPHVDSWEEHEYDETPPVRVERYLLDVVHCPGKDGASVMNVIDKQLGRIGLGRCDCVSGTGDGGMGNEGAQGIHSLLEESVPGYVRRRCLAHIAWRAAEKGFPSMGTVREGWKAIANHLHKGSLWARLKLVATTSVDYGGLALFVEGSPGYAAVFSKAPPTVMDTRPATDQEMAEWLVPRMHVLSRLIEHDFQRAWAINNDEDVDESKAVQI